MRKSGGQLSYDGKSVAAPHGVEALADGGYKVAIRPHHLPLRPPAREALQVEAAVVTTEITGSESFVHVEHDGKRRVALTPGVHRFEIAQRVPVYLHPAALLVFDGAHRLVAAPAGHARGNRTSAL